MIRTNVKRRKIGRSTKRHQEKEVKLNSLKKPISAKNDKISEKLDFTKLILAETKRKVKKKK